MRCRAQQRSNVTAQNSAHCSIDTHRGGQPLFASVHQYVGTTETAAASGEQLGIMNGIIVDSTLPTPLRPGGLSFSSTGASTRSSSSLTGLHGIVDTHRNDVRCLWRTVNDLLQPRHHSTIDKFSANDFATFFRSTVIGIRASTASATLPNITTMFINCLSFVQPVTAYEAVIASSPSPTTTC
jgi:hypothetical protein